MLDEHFTLDLTVKSAEGMTIPDCQCTVNIKDESGADWRTATTRSVNGRLEVLLPMPNPPSILRWELLCERFHPHEGVFFMPKDGHASTFVATVFRIPGQWKPAFTPLESLPAPRFERFCQVVSASDAVDLKSGGDLGNLGLNYNQIGDAPAVLGKMALLNLHSVLTDEQDPIAGTPWFDHVKKIIRLDQERFIAEVDADLYENVQTIINEIGKWKAKGFFLEASTCLHNGNIPPSYPPPVEEPISIKWLYEQGNLQLTLSFLRGDGKAFHILDCDMDEHANIVQHSADIGKHDFTGGTAPVEMHDYIALHSGSKQADGVSRCELGYTLL